MKKIILSATILFLFCFLALVPYFSHAFALFGFGESSSGLDCQKFWESFSDIDGLTIGGPRTADRGVSDWRFSSKKKSLSRVGGDSCDIGGIRHDSDSEGEDLNGFEIEISYFPNQEEAKAKLSSLKAAESVKVEDKNISGDTYSMRTIKLESVHLRPHFLAPGNFGRTVGRVGNCVVSLTHTWYGMAEQWNTGDEYDKQAGLMDIIMEGSRIGWQKLSEVENLQQFCGGKADSNQIRQESESVQPKKTGKTQPTPVQTPQTSAQNTTESQKLNPFNIFGINPYETWLNLLSLLNFRTSMEQGAEIIVLGGTRQERDQKEVARNPIVPTYTQNSDESYIAHVDELMNRSAKLNDEVVRKAQADWDVMFKKTSPSVKLTPFTADIVDGQVQVKYPGEESWRELRAGDGIPPGSTIFTGMDTTTVLSIRDKGAIEVLPFTEVTVSEEGLEQAGNEGKTSTDVKLKTGEVEINVEGGYYIDHFRVQTLSVTAGVRGTHFWVSYNKQTGASVVGVYKGTVAVSNEKGEREVNLTPQGDKPGVAVAIRKQSNNSLIWVLGGTVVGIGIVLWFIKRRKLVVKGVKRKNKLF